MAANTDSKVGRIGPEGLTMAEQEITYTPAAAAAVLSESIHHEIDTAALRKWRTRGLWPIEGPLFEEQRWSRFTAEDVARLYIMAQLNRFHGVALEQASHIARSKISFDEIETRPDHFLVFTEQGEQLPERHIAEAISAWNEDPKLLARHTLVSSGIVVDLAKVFRRVKRRLRFWGEEEGIFSAGAKP